MQPLRRVGLGRGKSFPFFGGDVEQHRAVNPLCEVEQIHQLGDVVAILGTEVMEAKCLEQNAWSNHRTHPVFNPRSKAAEAVAPVSHFAGKVPHTATDFLGDGGLRNLREVIANGPDVRRDGHPVIVQHHDDPALLQAAVVHGLVGHSAGHCPVANDGNHVVILPFQVASGGKAKRGGDRGGCVARAEDVVLTLLLFQERA
ncbi:MAG: hypothetical protein UZ07_CHB004001109 [Chlorobi bacterium OLB7]|nr:MAG: hypothetical protein UZ07_CHB004001109 [Chlorobi bacterium OLB7]